MPGARVPGAMIRRRVGGREDGLVYGEDVPWWLFLFFFLVGWWGDEVGGIFESGRRVLYKLDRGTGNRGDVFFFFFCYANTLFLVFACLIDI